jgi:hypothetical protein
MVLEHKSLQEVTFLSKRRPAISILIIAKTVNTDGWEPTRRHGKLYFQE